MILGMLEQAREMLAPTLGRGERPAGQPCQPDFKEKFRAGPVGMGFKKDSRLAGIPLTSQCTAGSD